MFNSDFFDRALSSEIMVGDCRKCLQQISTESIDCVVTSPPYLGLRDYGYENQIGAEETVEDYVANLMPVFSELRRVLRPKGALWLNLGDSYAGSNKGLMTDGSIVGGPKQQTSKGTVEGVLRPIKLTGDLKPKDLIGVPWLVAKAMRNAGWRLERAIVWNRTNAMPEAVRDRCTKSHEYIFAFGEPDAFHWEDSRHSGSVWTIPVKPFPGAHFATYPVELVESCLLVGSKRGDLVLDPFGGSGTTALAANRMGRNCILTEMNPGYSSMALKRLEEEVGMISRITRVIC